MEGEIFKASVIGELDDGTAIVNDFGFFDSTSGSGHIDTGTAAGDFQTFIQAAMVAMLPDIYTFKRYRFACVNGPSIGEVGYVEVSPPVTGGASSTNRMPNEICICVKRSTGHAGRGDRGRIFLGPVAEAYVSDANHPDYAASDLLTLANKLKANLTTQSRVLKPVLIKPDGTSNGRPILQVNVNRVFCHRRTRRPRVGA